MQCQKRTDTTFGNPVMARRELILRQQSHRERLHATKSSLDTRPPPPQPHLTLYGRDYAAKKKATTEAAFMDLKMIQAIARTMTRKHEVAERQGPVSLNAHIRKQEIYRVMSENHKLLDSIETCEPVLRTKDFVKNHQEKMRYVINSSHTMRLSGEYDTEIARIRREDRHMFETKKQASESRLNALRHSTGSVSLPSLTATTRSDPGPVQSGVMAGRGSPQGPDRGSRGEAPASYSKDAASSSGGGARASGQRAASSSVPAPFNRKRSKEQKTGSKERPSEPLDPAAFAASSSPSGNKAGVHFSEGGAEADEPFQHKATRIGTPHPIKRAGFAKREDEEEAEDEEAEQEVAPAAASDRGAAPVEQSAATPTGEAQASPEPSAEELAVNEWAVYLSEPAGEKAASPEETSAEDAVGQRESAAEESQLTAPELELRDLSSLLPEEAATSSATVAAAEAAGGETTAEAAEAQAPPVAAAEEAQEGESALVGETAPAEGEFEEEYEDEFIDESANSLNMSRTLKSQEGKDSFEAFEESATFEESKD